MENIEGFEPIELSKSHPKHGQIVTLDLETGGRIKGKYDIFGRYFTDQQTGLDYGEPEVKVWYREKKVVINPGVEIEDEIIQIIKAPAGLKELSHNGNERQVIAIAIMKSRWGDKTYLQSITTEGMNAGIALPSMTTNFQGFSFEANDNQQNQ